MLVSTYHVSDTERIGARRLWVESLPLMIGRAADCQVVVDDPEVAAYHLRVTNRDGAIEVENLVERTTGIVAEGDAVRIGGTIVKLRLQQGMATHVPVSVGPPANPPIPMLSANPPAPQRPATRARPRKRTLSNDPQEQQLLVAIRLNPGDEDSRMVYADWLEGHGFNAKAQLVRLREHLDSFMHRTATDIDWRAVAVRTPIDHCIRNKCPGHWDALSPLPTDDYQRRCASCQRDVRYCGDRNDVRASAWEGGPVVFDASLDRVAAHDWYKNWQHADEDDEPEDDPDGYTLDTPASNFRK